MKDPDLILPCRGCKAPIGETCVGRWTHGVRQKAIKLLMKHGGKCPECSGAHYPDEGCYGGFDPDADYGPPGDGS